MLRFHPANALVQFAQHLIAGHNLPSGKLYLASLQFSPQLCLARHRRVHPTPRQSAASAAFSVALGRIAADALAESGR